MPTEAMFGTVPDDEDLLYSAEHWDRKKIEAETSGSFPVKSAEAFVHPRTGTAARIMDKDAGGYSVQASMGDFADFDCVVQPDDPTEFLSGGATVIANEVQSLPKARLLAMTWLHGWVMRNSSVGDAKGDIIDSERE